MAATEATIVNYRVRPFCLYIVVPIEHQQLIESDGYVRRQRHNYVGLRENIKDAIEREMRFSETVNKTTHCVLEVTFTPWGLQHFATAPSTKENRFRPILHKCEYVDGHDWKVWHFLEDLPLHAVDLDGNVLISATWFTIS